MYFFLISGLENYNKIQDAFELSIENDEKKARCKICNELEVIKMKCGNTSGIRRHLKAVHGEVFRRIYQADENEKNVEVI